VRVSDRFDVSVLTTAAAVSTEIVSLRWPKTKVPSTRCVSRD
jgi:hypothetical protein